MKNYTKKNNKKKNKKKKELDIAFKIYENIFYNVDVPLVLRDASYDLDYTEFMNNDEFADLYIILEKFECKEYNSFAEVFTDIRRVFLNFYKYFGVRSKTTKKVLVIEEMLDNHISQLKKNLQRLADVQHTLDLFKSNNTPDYTFLYPKGCYDSALLRSVAHCRPERLKQYYNTVSNKLANDEHGAVLLKEILIWETEHNFNMGYHFVSSMYELLEIGHLILILFGYFDLEIIHQGEIERMFLIPKESTAMCRIMTLLLNPADGSKCDSKILPYEVWSIALSNKVTEWYEVYHKMKRCKVDVFEALGVHPDFWAAIGDRNPLVDHDFSKLPYFMQVWLVKGLCDHVVDNDKTINDIIMNCEERQCTIWKNENGTEEYFYFKTMPDFRLYCTKIFNEEPNLEFLKEEEIDEHTQGLHGFFRPKPCVQPDGKSFKMIADSVQAMRLLIEKLVIENKPESLINALEELLDEVEPLESSFVIANNVSKLNIYKDWKKSHFVETKKVNATSVQRPENIKVKRKELSEETEKSNNLNVVNNKKHKPGIFISTIDELTEYNDSTKYNKTKQLCNVSDFLKIVSSIHPSNVIQNESSHSIQTATEALNTIIKKDDNCPGVNDSEKDQSTVEEQGPVETEDIGDSCDVVNLPKSCSSSVAVKRKELSEETIDELTEYQDDDQEQLCNVSDFFKIVASYSLSAVNQSSDNRVTAIDNKSTNSLSCNDEAATEAPNSLIIEENNYYPEVNDSKNDQSSVEEQGPGKIEDIGDERVVANWPECCNSSVAQFEYYNSNKQIEQDNMNFRKRKETNNSNSSQDVKTKKQKKGTCIDEVAELNGQEIEQRCNMSDKEINIVSYWSESMSAVNPSSGYRGTPIENKSSSSLSCYNIATIEALNSIVTEDLNDSENVQSSVNQSKRVNINNAKELIPNQLQAIGVNQSKRKVDIEVITLDENSSSSENETTTTNDNIALIKNKNNEDVIAISDSDDDDDVEILTILKTPDVIPVRCYENPQSVSTVCNVQDQLLAVNSEMTLSNAVSVTSVNGNEIPKNNSSPAAMKQQSTIMSQHNVTKRQSTANDINTSSLSNHATTEYIRCEIVSTPSVDGEIRFSIRLPNGQLHPVSENQIIRQLKEHKNRLPHCWLMNR